MVDQFAVVLSAVQQTLIDNEQWLGNLDAAAGDGDHGRTILRGIRAALAQDAGTGDVPTRLIAASEEFSDAAGGASGVLFGSFAMTLGLELARDTSLCDAFAAALRRVQELGNCEPGDKTMVDALDPFVRVLASHSDPGTPTAWKDAADTATAAAAATANIKSRRGRSSKLGDRSIGTPDPGATSSALILSTIADQFGKVDV